MPRGADTTFSVGDIMTRDPMTVGPRSTVGRAIDELALGRIRHLPIVDKDGILVGLVTHRDLLATDEPRTARLSSIMRTDIKTVAPATVAHEAAYLLLRHRIGCIPVTEDDGRLIGIVTESDFVRIAYAQLGGRVPADEIESEEHEAESV